MKIAGIVCEYNPFHNGHRYHIEQTRAILGDDSAVICVMSGSAVQRGEFAMFPKHARAEAAVRSGADLVLELPAPFSVATAERFARGAVAILSGTGIVTHLSFGSESGDSAQIADMAAAIVTPEFDELLKKELASGISYPAARQRAAKKLCGDAEKLLSSPNNILGIEYCKAISSLNSTIAPLAVLRRGAEHDGESRERGFASASRLREILLTGGNPWSAIPESAADIFQREISAGFAPVAMKDSEQAILARLRMMNEADFAVLPDSTEGLHMRLMKFAKTEPAVSDIIEKTKTKRYTHSRIRRMVMYAYLGITERDMRELPAYARVLAFSETGRKLIRMIKARGGIEIITKPAAAKSLQDGQRRIFDIESAATDLRSISLSRSSLRAGGTEWKSGAVYVES